MRLEPAAGQNTLLDTKGVLEFASRSWNCHPRARADAPPGSAAWNAADCGYGSAPQHQAREDFIPLEEALQKAVSLLRQALPA